MALRLQLELFFNALVFFTRVPGPSWVEYSAARLNRASRYFPWVGWLVAVVAGGSYQLAMLLWSHELALLLSMLASILITGAFHEDGFADFCDGFGGGWDKAQILAIMKDSRLGTYGAIGLVTILALKWLALLPLPELLASLWLGHSLSRALAASFIYSHDYVREDASAKAKPLASRMDLAELLVALTGGLLPLLAFDAGWVAGVLLPLLLLRAWFGRYLKRWIGGYTGDCLGAAQQLFELTIYLYLGAGYAALSGSS